MRGVMFGLCVALVSTLAQAQGDPDAPKGRLSDAAVPTAYRLDLQILPEQPRFSGHAEIDVSLKAQTSRLYMHGRNLEVSKAVAIVGGRPVAATYTQVDPTGVVRLDFAQALPAGTATLVFDYRGTFGDSPSGLYHIKVGDRWYSWTQFESTDARAAFPSFDQPGFKTPFTISVATHPGFKAISNAPEASVTPGADGLEVHRFAPTRPLPTYLVAMDTGPFLHPMSAVPPDRERATPLPLGAVATQTQAGKLDFVLTQTPPIVTLLEGYFGQPFPFPKLDQIASPEMPGAMENAGADTYNDAIIVLDHGAPISQRQTFGYVVAHELSHQWFGDLVTPAWWDDIWLNESFADWMGYRIGDAWRPELRIKDLAFAAGFDAMATDALAVGRPVHQPIATTGEIDSAFDSITYGKGGQVIAMIAAYMGDDRFREGVRLHLSRHRYANATTDQFFQSLADAAHDPRIVPAMRSFVDQPGVPLVTFTRTGGQLTASQSRYALLGGTPTAERWIIPLCLRSGETRRCSLLDTASAPVQAPGDGLLIPNAGGAGYYRFEVPTPAWRALITAMGTLPSGEALAVDDSLWASFAAGRAHADSLIAEARSAADNPDPSVAVEPGRRLAGFRREGLIGDDVAPDYRRLMARLYAPRLAALGLDPAADAYVHDTPDRQKLRENLTALVVLDARDPQVGARLVAAAQRDLAGDPGALDKGLLELALTADIRAGGVPVAKDLIARLPTTQDPFRREATIFALASAGRPDVASWFLGYEAPGLSQVDRLNIIIGLAHGAETRDIAGDWILANYDKLTQGVNGIFFSSRLPTAFSGQCSAARADQVERELGPKVRAAGSGVLDFERTVEAIRRCGDLKAARQADVTAALRSAS